MEIIHGLQFGLAFLLVIRRVTLFFLRICELLPHKIILREISSNTQNKIEC